MLIAEAYIYSQLTIQERIKLQNTSEVGKFTSRERANRFSALKKLLYWKPKKLKDQVFKILTKQTQIWT